MKISFSPQGNRSDKLESLERQGSTLRINGAEYDFSVIPDGATLPNAGQAAGCELVEGAIERINGVLHITLLLPYSTMPQPQSVLFPEPVHVTEDGVIELPEVRHD